MKMNFPDLYESNEIIRYQFRANHVYILLVGLINLLAGLFSTQSDKSWKKIMGILSFVAIIAATVLLVAAFFIEPIRSIPQRPLTTAGIFLTFFGVILIFLKR